MKFKHMYAICINRKVCFFFCCSSACFIMSLCVLVFGVVEGGSLETV